MLARSAEFTVEGTIQSITHIPLPQNVSGNVTSSFRVVVSDCKWLIRVERPQQNVKSLVVEVGSDGNRIYSVSYIQKNDNSDLLPQAGNVRPGPLPRVLEEPLVNIVWLAYASHCYFQTVTNSQLAPLFAPSHQPLQNSIYTLPAKWTASKATYSLPETVVYFDDGIIRYWKDERDSWFSPPLTEPAKAPYENGYTNLTYVNKEWKEFGEIQIPVSFEVSAFGKKSRAQSSNDLFLATEFYGRATNILHSERISSFIPALPKNVRIREERFIHDSHPVHTFFYGVTEGKWLSDSEVKRLKEYNAQVSLEKRIIPKLATRPTRIKGGRSDKSIRTITLGVIVSITIVTAILGWRVSKKQQRRQRKADEN